MKVVTTFAGARAAGTDGVTGLVPTMGFLHEGHLSLMEAARAECGTVTVSLFVNPLQFGPGEDLDRYPRDLERDADLAEGTGADVLFAPEVEEMYPVAPSTTVAVAGAGDALEGPARPGHFAGVSTVVAKLFAGLAPDRAYFGRKDAQQLAVIRRMAIDLSFPVEVIGRPLVRDVDGLALSSRNVFLSPSERETALAIWRALAAASRAIAAGRRECAPLVEEVAAALDAEPGLAPEYVAMVDAAEVTPVDRLERDAFLAVAARVGAVRLIDNLYVTAGPHGVVPDLGIRLDRPSILHGRV